MGFNAEDVVKPLEWDFTRYSGGRGTSPEPSTRQIERYFRRQRHLIEALMRTQTAATTAEADRLKELSPEEAKQEVLRWADLTYEQALERLEDRPGPESNLDGEQTHRKWAELIAETTGGCPDVEQIMALPHRVRLAFFGWFTGELINPELAAADTRPSLSLVNSG